MTLLMTMVSVIQVSLFYQFGTFPSTIAWILVASIVPPLLFSAIETAKDRPTSVLGSSAWKRFEENPPSRCKMWCLRTFIIVFYPMIPAINICAREAAKVKKKKLLEKRREEFNKEDGIIRIEAMEKLEHVEKYLLEIRKGIMTFKLNELSWEVPLQLGLQLIMLLLGSSFSVTHSGLQAVLGKLGPGRLGPGKLGPSPIWRQIGPRTFWGPICHFLANRAPADWAPWRQIGPLGNFVAANWALENFRCGK